MTTTVPEAAVEPAAVSDQEDSVEDQNVVAEELVEEVSIDGMCGVY